MNEIDFSVTTDPASAAPDRFMIVFAAKGIVPMSFTGIKAYQAAASGQPDADIAVEWQVANQFTIQKYEVERSADGNSFSTLGTVMATGSNGNAGYNWTDADPLTGMNFYRIRATGTGGEIKYSDIVNVKIEKTQPVITIYPNPVTNHSIGLQFAGFKQGSYQLRLLNTMGQLVSTYTLLFTGTNGVQTFKLNKNISKGYYSLEIVKPDGSKMVKSVFITE